MYDIAICDDSEADCIRLAKYIMKSGIYEKKIRIHTYETGERLLRDMERISFSVVFLDIQMDGMNGDEVAAEIRRMDNSLVLVFYTGYAVPSPHSFEAQPYRYIIKNMPDGEIQKYVRDTLKKMEAVGQAPVLVGRIGRGKLVLKPDDIVFIEKYKKNTRAYINGNARELYQIREADVVRIPDKLENIYESLKSFGFGYPHDSYIINFKYMIRCTATRLVLEGEGKEFMITRSKSWEFNELKNIFWLLKYEKNSSICQF